MARNVMKHTIHKWGVNILSIHEGIGPGCVTFALGTFAPPILGHLLSLIPDICSPDICSRTFAPPYFGTSATPQPGTFAPQKVKV